MPLVQLIYMSKSVGPTIDTLPEVVDAIRIRNLKNDISSIVLTDSKYHLHVIEGQSAAVNALYNRIITDTRHTECTLLKFYEITRREFADFAAEFVNIPTALYPNSTDTLFHFSELDSSTLTPNRALTILRRVAAYCRVCKSSV